MLSRRSLSSRRHWGAPLLLVVGLLLASGPVAVSEEPLTREEDEPSANAADPPPGEPDDETTDLVELPLVIELGPEGQSTDPAVVSADPDETGFVLPGDDEGASAAAAPVLDPDTQHGDSMPPGVSFTPPPSPVVTDANAANDETRESTPATTATETEGAAGQQTREQADLQDASAEPPRWLYDEFSPPAESAPASATERPAGPAAATPTAPLSRPLVRPRPFRPKPAPLIAPPAARKLEQAARRSLPPTALLALLVLAVVAGLRYVATRPPSILALRDSGDLDSLLALSQGGEPALQQRAREAVLTLLPGLTESGEVSSLAAVLRSSDVRLQRGAVASLLEIEKPEALPLLLGAARDYTERLPTDLRVELIEKLAPRHDEAVTEALLDLLGDRSSTVREVAYAQLYARLPRLAEAGEVTQLAEVARRGDADLCSAALEALGAQASEAAVAPLVAFAADYSNAPELRARAVAALSALPGPEPPAALRERLTDFYPAVRQAAADGLGTETWSPSETAATDALRETAVKELTEAVAAHLQGRALLADGQPARWEDRALTVGKSLQAAAGPALLHAVFHDVTRRLRATLGRSPRMLRSLWQQEGLW